MGTGGGVWGLGVKPTCDPAVHIQHDLCTRSPWPVRLAVRCQHLMCPPMSMALRFRALMMFTMMELAEGL